MAVSHGYRHLVEIASGGMGRVYVAVRRGDSGHLYAVKRLHPHLRDHPRARQTLQDEARLAGNVSHANVLKVHESGADDEGPYLAMDYVEGCSLAELVAAVKRADEEIPLQICLEIARQMALGLHAIHEQVGGLLVVHRDVSPQNVLVDYDGVVRIADFGIAKPLTDEHRAETSTGVLKGKVGYMSPEQLRFERPDRRSDLFALGVVLYELLSGIRLYQGSDGTEGARRILHEPPPDVGDDREDTPPEMVQLLFLLLAKQPADRPEHANEVAERIGDLLEMLVEEEGPIDLGNYTASFFERERAARRTMIDAALERSQALDATEDRLGDLGSNPGFDWRVKGAAIAATIEYLETVYGEAGYARVVEIVDDEVQEALNGPVFVSRWYDGRVMVELTQAAQRLFGAEQQTSLAMRIGGASADYAFGDGGPYEVFREQGLRDGIRPFLDTSGEIYRLYYDIGQWRLEDLEDQSGTVRIVDGVVFPDSIVDRIMGFLKRGFELVGGEDVEVKLARSGDDLLLRCTWIMVGRPSRPPL